MAIESEGAGLLVNVVVYLGAAVVAVPVFRFFGLGSVLGYLVAGTLIGPFGLGLIPDVESVLHFSEFGVVMLLFLIGLELEPKNLWSMRASIIGSGGLQLVLSTLLIAAFALWMTVPWREALIVGMALALSSTAIALSTMSERNMTSTPAGQTGFSILLFQDIAVIPMIALLPLLAATTDISAGADWTGTLKRVAAVVLIILVGRFGLRHIFRWIAASGGREIFTAFSLFLVCAIAWLMQIVGLSMALGAFLAGVLLAESEYRHALEADIEPFKGLLLGLFFISVGMSINFALLVADPVGTLLLVVGLVVLKMLVLWLVAFTSRVPIAEHALFTTLLSQGGEFAFVLFGIAIGLGALGSELAAKMTLVVALSMVTTPLLLILVDRVIAPRFAKRDEHVEPSVFPDESQPVIVAGFGRFGQIIARVLNANHYATTVIDHNPNHLERIRRFGYKAYYGDAAQADLMHSAGAKEAKLIVVATDKAQTTLEIVQMLRSEFPDTRILARAYDRPHALQLRAAGAHNVVRETFVSALYAGRKALESLGYSAHEAHKASLSLRDHDRQLLEQQYAVREDDDAMVAIGRRSREALMETLESDDTRNTSQADRDKYWGTAEDHSDT